MLEAGRNGRTEYAFDGFESIEPNTAPALQYLHAESEAQQLYCLCLQLKVLPNGIG